MEVALAQHDVVVAADLDLVAVLGAEQHPVADLGRAHVLAERDDLGPHQPLGDLRGGRDEDAARRSALAVLVGDAHQQPIVEHLDRQLLVVQGHGGRVPPSDWLCHCLVDPGQDLRREQRQHVDGREVLDDLARLGWRR